MQPVFISHSSEDRYFVNLLVALLEYHGIRTWCSTDEISEYYSVKSRDRRAKLD